MGWEGCLFFSYFWDEKEDENENNSWGVIKYEVNFWVKIGIVWFKEVGDCESDNEVGKIGEGLK